MLRYRGSEDKLVKRVFPAMHSTVVPANAGTHNHREWIDEES